MFLNLRLGFQISITFQITFRIMKMYPKILTFEPVTALHINVSKANLAASSASENWIIFLT